MPFLCCDRTLLLSYIFYSCILTVFGVVIGKQTGRSIEMLNSFELVTNEVEGSVVVDTAYYEMKSEQCRYT